MTKNEIKSNENMRFINIKFEIKALLENEAMFDVAVEGFKRTLRHAVNEEKAKLAGESE
ncbi:hypothetical protein P8815_13750 [Bacillus altitudinis]|uniref:hypothetical protein n=1 Tax=Bacillus TaxID=1386 RepID=UPI000260A8F5|nr:MULTISPECIES: hypothetical protein [Bacillus]EIL85380.1 hypothetical protein BAME_14030 [Bacillus sp. M 2-6]MEC0472799.1 hypothetical protein [Bacillus altitudinis]NQW95344.1 hypothetical protein [Bacillus stratosphericus]